MTVGQRIAQKRKELGLSQESLGEQLGVSRQAIYKWESDAALPEVEKLVALSRIFSVPVGYLLGVEDAPEGAGSDAAGGGAPESGELTGEQLRMVEEIVERYLAAAPKAAPARPRRGRTVLAALALIAVAAALVSLFSRLDRVTQDYQNLQSSISRIDSNVNGQIGSIANRVEEILKSQNDLTADYEAKLLEVRPGEDTAAFSLRAVPRTYTEGMSALFQADCDGQVVEIPGTLGEGQEFSAQLVCPLRNSITLSVVFVTGDKRETQRLDVYLGLYDSSFPYLWFSGNLWFDADEKELPAAAWLAETMLDMENSFADVPGQAAAASIRVGLFRDRKLVAWYGEEQRETNIDGERRLMDFYVRPAGITMEKGSVYCEAVVLTDEYGRVRIYQDTPLEWKETEQRWESVSSYESALSSEGWDLGGE